MYIQNTRQKSRSCTLPCHEWTISYIFMNKFILLVTSNGSLFAKMSYSCLFRDSFHRKNVLLRKNMQ